MKIAYALVRTLSLVGYCFIILSGWMIGIPFILYLFFTLFELGTVAQLTAILSLTALFFLMIPFNFRTTKEKILFQIVIYFLILAPIVERLLTVPLQLFNYPMFIIPAALFVLLFPLSIILMYKTIRHKIELDASQ